MSARNLGPSLALAVFGVAVLGGGLAQSRTSVAVLMVGAGVVLLAVSPFAERVLRLKAKVGPAEVELELAAARQTVDVATSAGGEAPDVPVPDPLALTRYTLAETALLALLNPDEGPLAGCGFQLYLYDVDQDLLLPILEPAHPGPSPGFAPGQGVAGRAWSSGEYQVEYGDALGSASFGLSDEQRERYADLAGVAAVPVTNAAGEIVAVLSCATRDPGQELDRAEALGEHLYLADAVARVLIDVLKWYGDGPLESEEE